MTTYLLTGGTGNIGSLVAKALTGQGDAVVVYDLLPNPGALELVLKPAELQKTTIVQGDILDFEKLARTMKTHKVGKIAHFAVAPSTECMANPAHSIRVNIQGTNNVFDAAILTGVSRVVFSSSNAVFGPKSADADGMISNDAPFDPMGVYGACKVTNELTAQQYTKQFGLETVGLRYVWSYGPVAAVSMPKWIPELVGGLLRGSPVSAPRGNRPMEWCYVEDVARAVVMALQAKESPKGTFNLAGGDFRSIDSFIEMVSDAFPGAHIGVTPPPDWMANIQSIQTDKPAPLLKFDASAAKVSFGWEPSISCAAGLQSIIQYHRAALAAQPEGSH